METSKYLRLSSCGTALIPGTLKPTVLVLEGCHRAEHPHGSAISRSVSLMIRLGSAAMMESVTRRGLEVYGSWLPKYSRSGSNNKHKMIGSSFEAQD